MRAKQEYVLEENDKGKKTPRKVGMAPVMRRDLEGSAEGQAQLREWEQIRQAMQSVSREWPDAIDSDALFARIEAEISAPAVTEPAEQAPPVLQVVPGGRERRVWGAVATGGGAGGRW